MDLLEIFLNERNSSDNTRKSYRDTVRLFERVMEESLSELVVIAEKEQANNTAWKYQTLRSQLVKFRAYLFENYKIRSARMHLTRIIAIFRHFEISVEKLPYFSSKQGETSLPINPDKLIDRNILKLCINTANPLIKAATLFMSSSGLSRVDTLNLKVNDFLNATEEYHSNTNLNDILIELQNCDGAVGYWQNLKRQKTGNIYYTFSSPESTIAIAQYLLTREHLTTNSQLFRISYKYLNQMFKEINDHLNLGKNGSYSTFTPHMLRRYHATKLIEAGMSESKVDLLQGRKPTSVAYQSYVKIKPSKLREEYILCLPHLVVEDSAAVKTERDIMKMELDEVNTKNIELKNNIQYIWQELEDIKKRQETWEDIQDKKIE